MKLDKFIDKLISVGFIQNGNGADNWYENYINGKSVFVGIMGHEVDHIGHIPIEINIFEEGFDEIETTKDYMTLEGAWNAIKRML